MSSNALLGGMNLVKIGDGVDPEVFAMVEDVTSVTPPNAEVSTIDSTSMEDGYAVTSNINGPRNAGQLMFTIQWIPKNITHQTLEQWNEDPSTFHNFQHWISEEASGITGGFLKSEYRGFVSGFADGGLTPQGIMTKNVTVSLTEKAIIHYPSDTP